MATEVFAGQLFCSNYGSLVRVRSVDRLMQPYVAWVVDETSGCGVRWVESAQLSDPGLYVPHPGTDNDSVPGSFQVRLPSTLTTTQIRNLIIAGTYIRAVTNQLDLTQLEFARWYNQQHPGAASLLGPQLSRKLQFYGQTYGVDVRQALRERRYMAKES